MKKKQIFKITENFMYQTLGDRDPKHMCFSVCFPLSSFLWFNSVPNNIIHGHIPYSHFVLGILDSNKFVLDPTIRQFDASNPAIYFGPSEPAYTEFKSFDFIAAYNIWKYYLLNGGKHPPMPEDIPDDREPFDINMLLQFHGKAHALLQRELNSKSFKNTDHYRMTCMYLSVIDEAIRITLTKSYCG